MSRKIFSFAAFPGLLLILAGGCPMNGGPIGPVQTEGTWVGTVNCTTVQSLNDTPGPAREGTRSITLTIGANGFPTGAQVFGFSGNPDITADVSANGSSDTVASSTATLTTISQTITVTAIDVKATGFTMSLKVDYTASGGALTQTGTGTLVISVERSGDTLTYTADSDIHVTQTAGDIELDTSERITCTGTLTKQ